MNNKMYSTTKLSSVLTFLCLLMIGTIASASSLTSSDGVTVDGFNLPGISAAGWPNFENAVMVRWRQQGNHGYRLNANYAGGDFFFNYSIDDSYVIEHGSYQLKAWFDADGGFLNGDVKITGNLSGLYNNDGTLVDASGVLMTANLDSFAWNSDLLGFNTTDIICPFFDFCTENESAYLSLDSGDFDIGLKRYDSTGLAVTTVPIPAGIWLFGSGLIGMITLARRRTA